MRAIEAQIYKAPNYTCSINQLEQLTTVLIPCEEGYIDIKGNEPNLVSIVKRQFSTGEYIHVKPANPTNGDFFAFGGHFIYSSDSRFSAISKYPIPLHDRMMNLEK